jgi:predicted transcriptional regulator
MRSDSHLDRVKEIALVYFSKNNVDIQQIRLAIEAIHQGLVQAGVDVDKVDAADAAPQASEQAVRDSVTPEHIVSFEDGKPYKVLTKHLAKIGLTPASYRQKWGLPHDYPMVAPNLSKLRSDAASATASRRARRDPAEWGSERPTEPPSIAERRRGTLRMRSA